MNNPVDWFEIYVEDMDRAKAFYETVFDVRLTRLDSGGLDMWAFPMKAGAPGASGALIRMPGFRSGGNSALLYFSCANCAVEMTKTVSAGGRIQKEKFPIGEFGYLAIVIDTEGNMIGLHSMK